mmetsp:Transcript_759/g.2947  ORF Transcript_759/g.2947 Transcript_759/m.2947 type:complete len:217 (+) Transcript_759:897-1547(+)
MCSSACDCASRPGAVRKPQRGHATNGEDACSPAEKVPGSGGRKATSVSSDAARTARTDASTSSTSSTSFFFSVSTRHSSCSTRRFAGFEGSLKNLSMPFPATGVGTKSLAARPTRVHGSVVSGPRESKTLNAAKVNASPASSTFPATSAVVAFAGNAKVLLRVSNAKRGGLAFLLGSARYSRRTFRGALRNRRRSSFSLSASSNASTFSHLCAFST